MPPVEMEADVVEGEPAPPSVPSPPVAEVVEDEAVDARLPFPRPLPRVALRREPGDRWMR